MEKFNSHEYILQLLIKWGAVAYLSHSKYGINAEVNINNNSSYKQDIQHFQVQINKRIQELMAMEIHIITPIIQVSVTLQQQQEI